MDSSNKKDPTSGAGLFTAYYSNIEKRIMALFLIDPDKAAREDLLAYLRTILYSDITQVHDTLTLVPNVDKVAYHKPADNLDTLTTTALVHKVKKSKKAINKIIEEWDKSQRAAMSVALRDGEAAQGQGYVITSPTGKPQKPGTTE